MTSHVSRVSSERPLLGAVLCCTSISPEDRTRLAEYAQQMGAEHKLDLTSDVTHLIVGSTDTAKYAYVARERQDVRVLKPEWIEALRQLWMEDRKVDLNALDAQYRVETFAGLCICITGFDDLAFRSKLADNVKQNGGEYSGDLTKEVTHLIAANTDGRKYEFATIWGKKVVGLKWYKDSLERGMQLSEDTYHPTIPVDQQGLGAWNRQTRQQPGLGKRANEDAASQEPARKLRRTASARLSGQADNIWGDIVGGGGREVQTPAKDRDVLRPSKSMSNISRPIPDVPPFDLNVKANTATTTKQDPSKYLQGTYITIKDFDARRSKILRDVLDSLGASVFDDVPDLITDEDVTSSNSFIMVPYTSRPAALPCLKRSSVKPTLVSELWLEQCMTRKHLISVEEYPLGGMVAQVVRSDFENLLVNATGFESLTTLHISKVVALTGAKYTETFSDKCSVLIVNTGPVNNSSVQKQGAARQWQVPIVTEKWLWQLVKNGNAPPPSLQPASPADEDEDDNDIQQQLLKKRKAPANQIDSGSSAATLLTKTTISSRDNSLSKKLSKDHQKPPLGDPLSNMATKDAGSDAGSVFARSTRPASRPCLGSRSGSSEEALKEISPNSPTKHIHGHSSSRPTVEVYDGIFDSKENEPKDSLHTYAKRPTSQGRSTSPEKSAHDTIAMNSAIQDLLDMKVRARANAQKADHESSGKIDTRKTLLGRALSNLSNSSRMSNPRQSRASSIDSLNTDGVGSELPAPSGSHSRDVLAVPKRTNSMSLTGRATRKPSSATGPAAAPIDISDPNLCRDEYTEDAAPPLTQLGYEDGEEAIALREKLAERRRLRGKKSAAAAAAATEGDVPKSARKLERQVLRDDETMVAMQNDLGWGGKRRLRERKKDEGEQMMF